MASPHLSIYGVSAQELHNQQKAREKAARETAAFEKRSKEFAEKNKNAAAEMAERHAKEKAERLAKNKADAQAKAIADAMKRNAKLEVGTKAPAKLRFSSSHAPVRSSHGKVAAAATAIAAVGLGTYLLKRKKKQENK